MLRTTEASRQEHVKLLCSYWLQFVLIVFFIMFIMTQEEEAEGEARRVLGKEIDEVERRGGGEKREKRKRRKQDRNGK